MSTLFIPTWEARQIANNYNTDPNFAPTFSHLRTNVVPPFLRHNMCNYVKTSLLLLSVLLPTSQGGKVSDNSVNLVEKGSLTLSLSLLFYYYHWINIYIYMYGERSAARLTPFPCRPTKFPRRAWPVSPLLAGSSRPPERMTFSWKKWKTMVNNLAFLKLIFSLFFT